MRISDWSSDVCSSDLPYIRIINIINLRAPPGLNYKRQDNQDSLKGISRRNQVRMFRSEEHTSELQSLMRISYAVFCLKKKMTRRDTHKSKQNTTSQKDRES